MVKTREHSRFEIWGTTYVNNPDRRKPEDQKAEIVQIEPSPELGDYIVEVVKHE